MRRPQQADLLQPAARRCKLLHRAAGSGGLGRLIVARTADALDTLACPNAPAFAPIITKSEMRVTPESREYCAQQYADTIVYQVIRDATLGADGRLRAREREMLEREYRRKALRKFYRLTEAEAAAIQPTPAESVR